MDQSALIFLFMLLACTSTTMVVHCTPTDIFLLGGQSNMVGQGGMFFGKWDGVVPPESQSNPRILRLNNNSQWEEAREPLHLALGLKNQSCGVGPGMPFANSILKPDETIGLVPCAVVASYIDDWKRGTKYYNWTVDRARAAVSNGGGTIRALLWYQGESETEALSLAKAYKAKLVQFFTDLRDDLHFPSLPIIQVAITSGHNSTNMDIVREAQLTMRLPNLLFRRRMRGFDWLSGGTTPSHLPKNIPPWPTILLWPPRRNISVGVQCTTIVVLVQAKSMNRKTRADWSMKKMK